MSDQARHFAADSLDASVDALVGQMAESSRAGTALIAPESNFPDPPSSLEPLADRSDQSEQDSAAALLQEISTDIEQVAPGALPVVAAPAPGAPSGHGAQPTPQEIAAASAEVEADLGAFEAPSEAELSAPSLASGPLTETLAPPLAAAPIDAPAPASSGPGPDIQRLDAALAASAERVLAQAQNDLQDAPSLDAPPTPPVAVASVPPSSVSAPAPVATAAPVVAPQAPGAPTFADPPAIEPVANAGALAPLVARVRQLAQGPLRPLAALHEQLSEATRQTIGYCALITVFFALCFWGKLFLMKSTLEPVTKQQQFYDDTTPSHGVTAPPRSGDGHAGAKAAHAKGEAGGKSDGHGAPAKPAKKTADKKPAATSKAKTKDAKADAHGGH